MENEMIERVARAIDRADDVYGADLGMGEALALWVTPGMRHGLMRAAARAAIEAMREPNAPMLEAGGDELEPYVHGEAGVGVSAGWALSAWSAMIDAAITPRVS